VAYVAGSVVRLAAEVEVEVAPGAVPMDADTVVCTVVSPSGITSTPPVTRAGPTTYVASCLVDEVGRWTYQWTATAASGRLRDLDGGRLHVREALELTP
jgi:hypothetical protein